MSRGSIVYLCQICDNIQTTSALYSQCLTFTFHSVGALTEVVCIDYQFVQAIAIRLATRTTYFHVWFVIHSCFIQCYGILATENVIY